MVQLLNLYMTVGKKTLALTIPTVVNKVMSLVFNMMSRFVTGRGKQDLSFLTRDQTQSLGSESLES